MYIVGKALYNLFVICFIGKRRFVLFAYFCLNSRIRLCIYDPEVTEANNPTDECEFWITPSISQN